MFSSFKRVIVGVAAVIGFASSANAAYIPDSWNDMVGGAHYVGNWQSYTYSHNITDSGFTPGSDIVDGLTLSIDLWNNSLFDVAYVNVDIDSLLGGFVFGGQDFHGWSLNGSAELNDYGTLTVTITSLLGDFWVGTSTLRAWGRSEVPVPEPGTIALLGLGLLGVGLGRRGKLAK
jgi:hypothetical protein